MRYFRIVSLQLPRCKVALQSPSFSLSSLLKISPLSLFESKESFRKPKITSSSLQSWKNSNFSREYTSTSQDSKPAPFDRVSAIVDEISALTLLEASDLTEILRKKLDIKEMPVMAVMMPGMGIGIRGPKGGPSAKVEEKKAEKTAFDVKLEAFDASGKIKVIKEVRTFTNLGLKEAKDLVEKTPTLLKKGVTKEEAEKIIEKMKEVGAKVTME